MAALQFPWVSGISSAGVLFALLSTPFPLLQPSSNLTVAEKTPSLVQESTVKKDRIDERRTAEPKTVSTQRLSSEVGMQVTKEQPTANKGTGMTLPNRLGALSVGREEPSESAVGYSSLTLLAFTKQVTSTEPTQDAKKTPENLGSKPVPKTVQKQPIIGTASWISVPSVGIDIPVRSGSYDPASGTWAVGDDAAYHADTTVPVNDSNGTALIYGHAKWGLFGVLPDIAEGAEVIVDTVEGTRFIYVFSSVREVAPADVSMLTAEGEPRLLLQTCIGAFNQRRIVATFALKKVIGG